MENEQARSTAFESLDHCCRLVSELYGKPGIAHWTNSDYVQLGYILYKKTKVQISPSTLKRIFGKTKTGERYFPQKATRDALAHYLGFKDWEHFTYSSPFPGITEDRPAHKPVQMISAQERAGLQTSHRPRGISWWLAMLLALSAGGYYAYYLLSKKTEMPLVKLECSNPVGKNPHSAAFTVRGLPVSFDDHYLIEFGDGRKVSVTAGDSLYSHYYEVPGRYLAVLKRGSQSLDTVSVYLKTDAWTATAEMMFDTTRVYPVNTAGLFSNGKNRVDALEVSRAGVDTNRTFFVKFLNTQQTDIDGDNFDLSVKLKTSADRAGVRCSQVRVIVFGEQSKHLIDVMKPGCEHWTDMQFSEISKQGEFNKLDFLGADLREGGIIGLNVVNKRATVMINHKKVFETAYQKPLKKIYGLGIFFSGIGEIQSVSLKDTQTNAAFSGNF
ncbi:hypothetical protein DSL64_02345 [Dyadobacter luteus]|uniref:PKD domain-containing protein n=1 Tax=Dyadobacter luteus TaxID=2259619 RepID=A0A3D8YI01_9BACT|nr:hypothetical protein [Dyadobacter luteus]REA64412.1 hypothetical protein DSL64_02345 [Dyadobacter luteus]